jgi:hypothetical protein
MDPARPQRISELRDAALQYDETEEIDQVFDSTLNAEIAEALRTIGVFSAISAVSALIVSGGCKRPTRPAARQGAAD